MTYRTWKDRANNIGVQCDACDYTVWNNEQARIDISRRPPCLNCRELLTQDALSTEMQAHADEAINKTVCIHKGSQP